MRKFEFCIRTVGKFVSAGADWFHEIKYDDYASPRERDGDRARLITRGHDWTKHFPSITEAALRNRASNSSSMTVVLGVADGGDCHGCACSDIASVML